MKAGALIEVAEPQSPALDLQTAAPKQGDPDFVCVDFLDGLGLRRVAKIPGALHAPRGNTRWREASLPVQKVART